MSRGFRIPAEAVQKAPVGWNHNLITGPKMPCLCCFDGDPVRSEPADRIVLLQRLSHFRDRDIDHLAIGHARPETFALGGDIDAPTDRDGVVGTGDAAEVRLHWCLAIGWCRRLDPLPEDARQDFRRPTWIIGRGAEDFRDSPWRHVDNLLVPPGTDFFKSLRDDCRLPAINGPFQGVHRAAPFRRWEVDEQCPCMTVTAEPIQSAQPLGQCTNAARLGDEVLSVKVGTDFKGLRRDHDEMSLSCRVSWAIGRHSVGRIEDARPDLFRLSLAHETGQQQQLSFHFRQLVLQVLKHCPRCLGRVGED